MAPGEYHEENPVGPTNLELHSLVGDAGRVPRPDWRPITRYEAAGLAQGRTPVELAYRRI